MLYRKIQKVIEDHLTSKTDRRILMIEGARQVGKTFIIDYTIRKLFKTCVEINMIEDYKDRKIFDGITSVEKFYMAVNTYADLRENNNKTNTIIFLDEIQRYPDLIPLLKFLNTDGKYTYIVSGSLLGVTMYTDPDIPMGYVRKIRMYPLDFEEFLLANGVGKYTIDECGKMLNAHESIPEGIHNTFMENFRKYLLVGGLPQAINIYLSTHNFIAVREFHHLTIEEYRADAARYDSEHHLKIGSIYDLISSNMECRKKRVVANQIDNKKKAMFEDYKDEFDYLIGSGIALEVKAISNPVYPLIRSATKNLLKLYYNDVGILTTFLYDTEYLPVMNDVKSINLGSLYENAVACELAVHKNDLYYYDNKANGEVDFLINDPATQGILPIEVKSGKDYTEHSALNKMLSNKDYTAHRAYVLSNDREVFIKDGAIYLPVYYTMYIQKTSVDFIYI
ncbi:MAG: AAA family ATPase [Clostridia bacterium]|nr:AAA family ATPase [Clostridia bacterium]